MGRLCSLLTLRLRSFGELNNGFGFWVFGLPAAALFSDVIGLFALPLCGAAPTFFAAAKKVGKRKRLTPLTLKRVPRPEGIVAPESGPSHIWRE